MIPSLPPVIIKDIYFCVFDYDDKLYIEGNSLVRISNKAYHHILINLGNRWHWKYSMTKYAGDITVMGKINEH
jgi:hypothetical protein